MAGNLLSPYGTFGPTVQPGSTRGSLLHELRDQLFDIRVPTERYRTLIARRLPTRVSVFIGTDPWLERTNFWHRTTNLKTRSERQNDRVSIRAIMPNEGVE